MQNLGYYNGEIGAIEDMMIPMSDRAAYFGDGIYDAARCTNDVIYLLDEHIDRFFANAERLQIHLPYDKAYLKDLLYELIGKVEGEEKFVYFQASRCTAPRKHAFAHGEPNLYITVTKSPYPDYTKKVQAITVEDTRFLHCDIKTINLLVNVLAAQKAAEANCYEAVFHRGDRVTECSHSNISILKDGVFRTAPTDNYILPGIARSRLLAACERLGIPAKEEPFTLEELMAADEVIISGTSNFCIGVDKVDAKPVGGKAPALFEKLQNAVLQEYWDVVGKK